MKKDDTLLIKINKEDKKKFISLCKAADTTASRELRTYIKRILEKSDKLQ